MIGRLLLLASLAVGVASAQSPTPSLPLPPSPTAPSPTGPSSAVADRAWVRVQGDAGTVAVDSVARGAVGDWIAVAPGTRRLARVEDGVWNPRRAETTVDVADGDSVTVALAWPLRVRVETMPIRATVVRTFADGRRETLGPAPLTVTLAPDESATLEVSREDYQTETVSVEAGRGSPVTVLLAPAPGAQPDVALLPTERSTRRRTLVDVGIASATLAAGALAVHYKFRADAVDDRYRGEDPRDRGDESLRQEALRLDRVSAAALVGMQVGVGTLALRFVLR